MHLLQFQILSKEDTNLFFIDKVILLKEKKHKYLVSAFRKYLTVCLENIF